MFKLGVNNRRCLRIAGAMPFTLVGVLASLTAPVARAGVFAFSTFDTNYLLVKSGDLQRRSLPSVL